MGGFGLMPINFELVVEETGAYHQSDVKFILRRQTGINIPESAARTVWPRILEHKWYLSERLGRDVGLRVAAIDYLENIQPLPGAGLSRTVRDKFRLWWAEMKSIIKGEGELSPTSLAAFEYAMRGTRSLAR